ncbi:fimbrial protein [Serratia fonticola]|uniref:fimbrial protein n=1 Tax=Serratia fonticola TaxID=47917 RepID=UPI00217BCEF7|nr:fimbrial protein [Serratia fonticola]CAI2025993.1 Major MR/P fimbria protein precursor [Serratia fonticola]
MHIKNLVYGGVLMMGTVVLNIVMAASPPSMSVRYSGSLVAEPCTILPEDESIAVDFGTVIDKYLYLNNRTLSKPFQLHLIDCDTELGKSVKMTFSGAESITLPGLLALEAGSDARGVAIGLETRGGKSLPFNQQSPGQEITDGNNTIILQAYVQSEPDALRDKSIRRGAFTAVAIFALEYE